VLGLYIHVPFCVRKCDYCDFYSLPERLDSLEAYIEAVLTEAQKYRKMSFQTIYLGGGTPSLLRAAGLSKLMYGLKRVFDLSGVIEATLEANPESVTRETLEAALENGINRISIGVQSLSNSELKRVGRIHTAEQAAAAIELAHSVGFNNISGDLILGLPGQDRQSLMLNLETLIGLDIQHLSLYCLSVEPHTPLAANLPADLPSDDEQAELYREAVNLTRKRGFTHYEISNLTLPEFECLHNLNYWRGGEYIALGPAAASHYEGKRYKNRADLDAYIRNPTGQVEEIEELPPSEKAAEEAILRLRLLREGLDLYELTARYGDENVLGLAGRLNDLSKEGTLLRNGSRYYLPEDKALVSNPILARVLGD